jgi:hypothetical protein
MEAIIDQAALGGALQNAAVDPRELSEVVMDENRPPPQRAMPSRRRHWVSTCAPSTRHPPPGGRQEGITESELEPKTSSELRQLIAELSSLSPNVFRLHTIGDVGNFTATMIAGTGVRGAVNQSNLKAICDHLRLNTD